MRTRKNVCQFLQFLQCIVTIRLQNWDGHSTKQFIGCSNWDSAWRVHDTANIPEDVDPDMLKRLFKGKSLSEFETVLSCARIVPGHIGGKIRRCRKLSFLDSRSAHCDSLLRLSPFFRWDLEQNGPA